MGSVVVGFGAKTADVLGAENSIQTTHKQLQDQPACCMADSTVAVINS